MSFYSNIGLGLVLASHVNRQVMLSNNSYGYGNYGYNSFGYNLFNGIGLGIGGYAFGSLVGANSEPMFSCYGDLDSPSGMSSWNPFYNSALQQGFSYPLEIGANLGAMSYLF